MENIEIKSSNSEAIAAIEELTSLDLSQKDKKQVDFKYSSGIFGMEYGKLVANQMLDSLINFSEVVLEQANKFPQIAAVLEEKDVDLAQRWRK